MVSDPIPGPVVPGEPSEPHAEPTPQSTSGRAVRGGAFILAGHATVNVLRMGGQIVLTRLLPPEAFGIMAIVHSFRGAIDLFSDLGIGPSIIQNERGDDPIFLDTAWTIQFVRGIALFLVASALAVPFAYVYEHAELRYLIPISSVAALLAGVQSVKYFTAERHLDLARPALIEVLAQVAALTVMVIWALVSPSVWALVAGGLTGAVMDVVLAHALLRGHNARLRWDKSTARSLLRFGKWIFLSTLLTYTVGEADRLIFGKLTTLGDLGVYHVALTIASVPTGAMHQLAGKVIFPLFSRVRNTGEDLAQVFRRARQLHLVLSGWALSGLIGGGQAAVALVYEGRYEDGGWMLQLLAMGCWFATPDQTNAYVNLASGRPRWLAAANFGKLVGMVLLIPVGYTVAGFRGALAGFAMAELFRYAVSTTGVYRHGLRTMAQDLKISAVVLAASVAGRYTVTFLHERGVHVALQCLAVFAVVTVVWLRWLWPYLREVGARIQARFGN